MPLFCGRKPTLAVGAGALLLVMESERRGESIFMAGELAERRVRLLVDDSLTMERFGIRGSKERLLWGEQVLTRRYMNTRKVSVIRYDRWRAEVPTVMMKRLVVNTGLIKESVDEHPMPLCAAAPYSTLHTSVIIR